MIAKEFCEIAGRLMRRPAAPYHEHEVRAEARRICDEHGLANRLDDFGNLLVFLNNNKGVPPLAFAAHLDHPGFTLRNMPRQNGLTAEFEGGVPDQYFKEGTPIRLMPRSIKARLGRRIDRKKRLFAIETTNRSSILGRPEFAVWDLEDFAVRKGCIYGRACDDLVGVASALAALIDLKRARARVNALAIISRAEEIGFHGALSVAAGKKLDRRTFIVSLETSRELPPVKMGQGVIIRVGDRTSIFDSEGTRFLSEAATLSAARDSAFKYQRALMSGGTCEATAYQEFGYRTAAVCVALGNYHNCGASEKIGAEYVSVADALAMVELLCEAARQMPHYKKLVSKLPIRLGKLLGEARNRVKKSP